MAFPLLINKLVVIYPRIFARKYYSEYIYMAHSDLIKWRTARTRLTRFINNIIICDLIY